MLAAIKSFHKVAVIHLKEEVIMEMYPITMEHMSGNLQEYTAITIQHQVNPTHQITIRIR